MPGEENLPMRLSPRELRARAQQRRDQGDLDLSQPLNLGTKETVKKAGKTAKPEKDPDTPAAPRFKLPHPKIIAGSAAVCLAAAIIMVALGNRTAYSRSSSPFSDTTALVGPSDYEALTESPLLPDFLLMTSDAKQAPSTGLVLAEAARYIIEDNPSRFFAARGEPKELLAKIDAQIEWWKYAQAGKHAGSPALVWLQRARRSVELGSLSRSLLVDPSRPGTPGEQLTEGLVRFEKGIAPLTADTFNRPLKDFMGAHESFTSQNLGLWLRLHGIYRDHPPVSKIDIELRQLVAETKPRVHLATLQLQLESDLAGNTLLKDTLEKSSWAQLQVIQSRVGGDLPAHWLPHIQRERRLRMPLPESAAQLALLRDSTEGERARVTPLHSDKAWVAGMAKLVDIMTQSATAQTPESVTGLVPPAFDAPEAFAPFIAGLKSLNELHRKLAAFAPPAAGANYTPEDFSARLAAENAYCGQVMKTIPNLSEAATQRLALAELILSTKNLELSIPGNLAPRLATLGSSGAHLQHIVESRTQVIERLRKMEGSVAEAGLNRPKIKASIEGLANMPGQKEWALLFPGQLDFANLKDQVSRIFFYLDTDPLTLDPKRGSRHIEAFQGKLQEVLDKLHSPLLRTQRAQLLEEGRALVAMSQLFEHGKFPEATAAARALTPASIYAKRLISLQETRITYFSGVRSNRITKGWAEGPFNPSATSGGPLLLSVQTTQTKFVRREGILVQGERDGRMSVELRTPLILDCAWTDPITITISRTPGTSRVGMQNSILFDAILFPAKDTPSRSHTFATFGEFLRWLHVTPEGIAMDCQPPTMERVESRLR